MCAQQLQYSDDQLQEIFYSGIVTKEQRVENSRRIVENHQLAVKEQALGRTRLSARPSRAKMSLTALCNVKCVFCGVCRKMPKKRTDGTLFPSDKVITQWLRIILSLKSLELFREGESFLNKDFFKFARFARNMGVQHITNSTNGMALTKEIADQVAALPLDALKFSIQGADNQSVKKMMPGASWEKICSNIECLCDLIHDGKGRSPALVWSMVLCAWNLDQLVPAVRKAVEWHFNSFIIHYIGIWGDEIAHLALKGETLSQAEKNIREAKAIAEKAGMFFKHPQLSIDMISNHQTDKPTDYVKANCFWPWQNLELDASGDVMPCCGGQKAIGNLNDTDIDTLWNSKQLVAIRKGVSTGNLDPACRKCHYGFKE